ncbi:serine/threonine-protein kinase pim-3-like, partial [Astyanax mexicanus]
HSSVVRALVFGASGREFGPRWSLRLQIFLATVPNVRKADLTGMLQSQPVQRNITLLEFQEPENHEGEAKICQRDIDSIVKLIEWFDEPERFILILERPQPCVDLETFLDSNGGSLTKTMFKDIMLQAVRAAMKCYQRGVLHRDIKPKNFVINTDTMELKLIDFGCGDCVRRDGYANFAGTFKYCPPEYLLSKRYHARSATVWSLGVLLFRMICGYHPFTTAKDILEGISYLENSQSDECWDLIHWCLQCEPTMRPSFQQILLHDWFESA